MATPKRPLSPFMIGPYYRPQLTSMLSIAHRATGVFLALLAFGLALWLSAVAGGFDNYDALMSILLSTPGKLVLLAGLASLFYHLFNGIRHLLWDIGWGFELPRMQATGWAVVLLSLSCTALFAWFAFAAGASV
jgi:succinate dehydrogenase / fumarate reductase cytochrome b subunit